MGDSYPFLKGHGTENDFVLLPDPDGSVHGELDPALVAALCDRHAGIGGDGVMRAIRTAAYDDPAAVAARTEAEWFMDYRNSDGSLSEMCGNGIRLFARYLADYEGVDTSQPVSIGTRGGIKVLTFEDGRSTGSGQRGRITADMGCARVLGESKVSVGERSWPSVHVDMGNSHAVVFVDDLDEAGPLLDSPDFDESVYPQGVNIEFVVHRGDRHVAMRVFERGSGETRSCGTGACAVMVAAATNNMAARAQPTDGSTPTEWRVDVPGGELDVTWTAEGRVLLTGPAVIVAEGKIPKSFAAASVAVQPSSGPGNTTAPADVVADG